MPSVAAIIPAFNAAAYIGRAAKSVCAQTWPVDALVIVDDGSTDDTCAVVGALGPGIGLIRQTNAGPSAARNRGAREVSAAYLAFLDADDEWLPGTLAKLMRVFAEHPEVALVTADMAAIDDAGRIHEGSWFASHGMSSAVAAWAGRPVPNAVAALLRKNFVSTSVVVVRADVYRELGGFREDLRFGEDLELWARIAARHPVVCLGDVLGLRRSHPGNTTKCTEAMLADLVRMSEIVRGWGREILRNQGVDADTLVARARTDLGYWYFSAGRRAEARAALVAATREHATPRALRYLALSCLPSRAIAGLRRLKAELHG
jgi:glycosyltransferase involved in cell wall biosynthesis